MNSVESLESRLVQVAAVLRESPDGLALLGLGSAGIERERLDQWSDLDFFAIVRDGRKPTWLEDPSWLDRAHPLAYRFRNTADGFKLLWADGIFAEMAVFEAHELAGIPYAEGRLVWAHQDFDPALARPVCGGQAPWKPQSVEWSIGELLTCLYVGLCRWRRGERLSAWRFVQCYCLDRFMEVVEATQTAGPAPRDQYAKERRFEDRYPAAAVWLPRFLGGYDRVPETALAFLEWAESVAPVNAALKAEIVGLARG
jgi:hypothetical protein